MRKICLRCGSKFSSQAEYCAHDGSLLVTDEDVADPLLGTVLLEQFRIDEQIGTGGMGTVYRAHQTTVGRDFAIKVLRAELARDDHAVLRFEREARLATSLDHPNLVRVFLSGRLSDGRLYIVMELLQGRSLAEELETRGPLDLERALIIIMKLCAGLGAVHAAGIVHRDIKPENVYLTRKGGDDDFVKLVDFGIARALEADGFGPTTTQTGRVFGTATYISPEAAGGDDTDHRSDIYSLGVLAYQLLTGELPFEGSTAAAVLMQHVHKEPPSLATKGRGAEVPEEVARVVMRALSKDPDARQQTLAEFLDSLAEAAGNAGMLNDARTLLLGTVWGGELSAPGSYLSELLGASVPSSLPPALADTRVGPQTRDPEEEALLSSAPKPFGTTSHELAAVPGEKKRSPAWWWALLGSLLLVLVGVVAGMLWDDRVPEAPPAPSLSEPMPTMPKKDPDVADVGTDLPIVDPPVFQGPLPEEPVVEQAPEPEPPAPKPKKKRKKRSKKQPDKTEPRPAPDPAPEPKPAPALEPDEGIDWSVPDFPEEPPPVEPPPPSEPPAPTGTPDAPARNPIVIDEPPKP